MTAREYKITIYNYVSRSEDDLSSYINGTKEGTGQWYTLNGRAFATNEIKHRIIDTPTCEGKNVDWIREMATDKLAHFLAERGCPDDGYVRNCNNYTDCAACWMQWLNDCGGE